MSKTVVVSHIGVQRYSVLCAVVGRAEVNIVRSLVLLLNKRIFGFELGIWCGISVSF